MGARGKVLVIDDDPDFLEFTRIVLESAGHEVCTAGDVLEGIETMCREKPDVVILDVMISYRLDGFNVIEEMRKDTSPEKASLIMVSAIVNREEIELSWKDQCVYDCFMSKPILPADLLEAVDELLT